MSNRSYFLLVWLVCFAIGCAPRDRVIPEDQEVIRGTVRYVDLEGGFFGIETTEGERLDPVNLKDNFRKDGLRVEMTGRTVTDVMSVRMWGTPFEIDLIWPADSTATGRKR